MVVHEIWSSATWIFSVVSLIFCINNFQQIVYLEKESRPFSREKRDGPLSGQTSRHEDAKLKSPVEQKSLPSKNQNQTDVETFKQSDNPSGSKEIPSDESKQQIPSKPVVAQINLDEIKKEPREEEEIEKGASVNSEKVKQESEESGYIYQPGTGLETRDFENRAGSHSTKKEQESEISGYIYQSDSVLDQLPLAFDQGGKPISQFGQHCCPCDPINYIKKPKDCFTLAYSNYEPESHQQIVKNKEKCVTNKSNHCIHCKKKNNEEKKKMHVREQTKSQHCISKSCPEKVSACKACIMEQTKIDLENMIKIKKSLPSLKGQVIPKHVQKDAIQTKQMNIPKTIQKDANKELCPACNQILTLCQCHKYQTHISSANKMNIPKTIQKDANKELCPACNQILTLCQCHKYQTHISSAKQMNILKTIPKDVNKELCPACNQILTLCQCHKYQTHISSANKMNIPKTIPKDVNKELCQACNQILASCQCHKYQTYTSVIYSKKDPFKINDSEKIQSDQSDNLNKKESNNISNKQALISLKNESKIPKKLKSKVKLFNILPDHYLFENEKSKQFEKNKLQNTIINKTETDIVNTKRLELKTKSISEPFDSKIISSFHHIASATSQNDNCFEYSSNQNSRENIDVKMDQSSIKKPLKNTISSKSSSVKSFGTSKKNKCPKYYSKTKLEKENVSKIINKNNTNLSKRSSSQNESDNNSLNAKIIPSKTSSFEVTEPKFVNILPTKNSQVFQKQSSTKSNIHRIASPFCGAIRKKSSQLLSKIKQSSKNDLKLKNNTSKTKSSLKTPWVETRNITKQVNFESTKHHQDRSLSLSPQRQPVKSTINNLGHHGHNRHLSFSPSRIPSNNQQMFYLNDIKKYDDLQEYTDDYTFDNPVESKPNCLNKSQICSDFDLHDCFHHDNRCCTPYKVRSRDCSETDFDYSGTIWSNLDNLVRQSNWTVLLFEIKYIMHCQECHLDKEALFYLYHHYILEYINLVDPLDAVETTILIMEALKEKTEILETLRKLETAVRYCNQAVALIKIIQAALILDNSPEHTKTLLDEAEINLNKEKKVYTRVLNRLYLLKTRYYLKVHDFDNCFYNTLKYLESADQRTLKAQDRNRYIKSLPILSLISEMNFNQLELLKEPFLSGVVSFSVLNLVEYVGQGKVTDTKKLLKKISNNNQYSCIIERSEIIIDKARLHAVLQIAYRNDGYISLKKAASLAEIKIERLPDLIARGIKAGLYYATIQNDNIIIVKCQEMKNKSTQLELSMDENESADDYLESLLGPDEKNIL